MMMIMIDYYDYYYYYFTEMLKDLKFDEQWRKYNVRKIINICIRSSYYIFCKRNKEWDNPQLMSY
jgi:hypothetical protein